MLRRSSKGAGFSKSTTLEELEQHTADTLRNFLRSHGITSKGSRSALALRVRRWLDDHGEASDTASSSAAHPAHVSSAHASSSPSSSPSSQPSSPDDAAAKPRRHWVPFEYRKTAMPTGDAELSDRQRACNMFIEDLQVLQAALRKERARLVADREKLLSQ
eukprot:m51a1_g3341 hypothetical protein (161) ;mRNA; r:397730-398212